MEKTAAQPSEWGMEYLWALMLNSVSDKVDVSALAEAHADKFAHVRTTYGLCFDGMEDALNMALTFAKHYIESAKELLPCGSAVLVEAREGTEWSADFMGEVYDYCGVQDEDHVYYVVDGNDNSFHVPSKYITLQE